jgi:hypothetical protein
LSFSLPAPAHHLSEQKTLSADFFKVIEVALGELENYYHKGSEPVHEAPHRGGAEFPRGLTQ